MMTLQQRLHCTHNQDVLPKIIAFRDDYHYFDELENLEMMKLDECIFILKIIAKKIKNNDKEKLSRLTEIQLLLLKEQQMGDDIALMKIQMETLHLQNKILHAEAETHQAKRQELEAKMELERQKIETERQKFEAKMELEREKLADQETKTKLLTEQSKLHMRGLIELFEREFSQNLEFIRILKEKKEALDKSFKTPQKVDRKTKWSIMLNLPEYSDLKDELLKEAGSEENFETQMRSLMTELNKRIHKPFDDMDPPGAGFLVINACLIGTSNAQMLKCIAKKCKISHMVIP